MNPVVWCRLTIILSLGLVGALVTGLIFSSFTLAAGAPQWVQTVAREIQAACRDAGTQWMVVVCLVSYLIVFAVLARRFKFQVSSLKSKVTETFTSPRPSPLPAGAEREAMPSAILPLPSSFREKTIFYLLTSSSSPTFWLGAFVALVLLRYAFDYSNAAKSLQVGVLLTGMVVGKGIALWVAWPSSLKSKVQGPRSGEGEVGRVSPLPAESAKETGGAHGVTRPTINYPLSTIHKAHAVLAILTLLLACAALWHPERGMEYFYRGQPRWTGPWDNPNLFGVLMGVGVVLAGGLLVQSLRSKGQGREAEAEGREPGQVGRGSPLPAVGGASVRASRLVRSLAPPEEIGAHGVPRPTINSAYWSRACRFLLSLFLLSALVLCAFGLLKSYSRGAWLGTAIALAFILFQGVKFQGSSGWAGRVVSLLRRLWLPSSILILSILVISFWQFRHTEAPLARRVFSVGNPNDFSWRNRVAAWEGAGRMMGNKPLIGFGWGKAEEVYSKEYRAARLEESAAIQMNDYLMIGISAGGPALGSLLVYLYLVVGRGAGKLSTFNFQPSTAAKAGVVVLLISFWFDGGLFKLPTCVVFWVLVELARISPLPTSGHPLPVGRGEGRGEGSGEVVPASRLVGSLAPPKPGGAHGVTRPTIALRWLAGMVAAVALGLTVLHLGTPQLAVSERTLAVARRFLVPAQERSDFEFLAAKKIWSNTPLKTLLQHAHLANYNRTLVNWKLDEPMYREFVLSPEIFPSPGLAATLSPSDGERDGVRGLGEMKWRRPLWEHFYPRIRKESSMEVAVEIIVRNLNETCRRRGDETQTEEAEGRRQKAEMGKSIAEIWRQQEASDAEFARICVAAWRAVGIPARLGSSGSAEFWNGSEWKEILRPVAAGKELRGTKSFTRT